MTEFDAERFLLAREQFGMRFGLERMRRLLTALGCPDEGLPAVHVVGTNGKSSTTRFAAAALGGQGLTVGCFTSPHLRGFFERVSVSGVALTSAAFGAAARQVADAVAALDQGAADDDRVTQFEAVWALALCAFRAAGCDAIVAEAGLGGRLDATNTLSDSRVQVLTGVGLDHTELLGETIEQIAAEKLAVVREGAVLVHGMLPPAARLLAARVAMERDSRLVVADAADAGFGQIGGEFMRRNATLGLTAAEAMLGELGGSAAGRRKRFDRGAAVAAVLREYEGGALTGRLTVEGRAPLVVFDSAHNGQAADQLAAAMAELADGRPLMLVIGVLTDKRVAELVGPLVAGAERVFCTRPSNPRGLPARELARVVHDVTGGAAVVVEPDPRTALAAARVAAGPNGVVLACGSNYLISDLVCGDSSAPGATF